MTLLVKQSEYKQTTNPEIIECVDALYSGMTDLFDQIIPRNRHNQKADRLKRCWICSVLICLIAIERAWDNKLNKSSVDHQYQANNQNYTGYLQELATLHNHWTGDRNGGVETVDYNGMHRQSTLTLDADTFRLGIQHPAIDNWLFTIEDLDKEQGLLYLQETLWYAMEKRRLLLRPRGLREEIFNHTYKWIFRYDSNPNIV